MADAAILMIVLLVFFTVFGLSCIPTSLVSQQNRKYIFLAAPLIGYVVWLALSVFGGLVFKLNAAFTVSLFTAVLLWIFFRRRTIFIPKDKIDCIVIFFSFLLGMVIFCVLSPAEIDGGLYFNRSVYDHVRCTFIDSIATFGIPPLNPWLADAGKQVEMIYYFGWFVVPAQLEIVFGFKPLFLELCFTGFTALLFFAGFFAFSGLVGAYRKSYAMIFTFLLIISGELCTTEPFIGFWCIVDNLVWSPHHLMAGIAILFIILGYVKLLECKRSSDSLQISILLGVVAASVCFMSIYAGVMALMMFVAIVLCLLVKNDFRIDFVHSLKFQLLAIAVCLIFTGIYFTRFFEYPSETAPLAVGLIPGLNSDGGIISVVKWFLWFYFYALPCRLWLVYILGVTALIVPGILPENRTMLILKAFTALSTLIIFFVHTTYYSNDFGWRSFTAACFIYAVFSVFTLFRLFEAFNHRKVFLWLALAGSVALSFNDIYHHVEYFKKDSTIHKAFKEAVPGWEVVRKHTLKTDLVLSNPVGFFDLGEVANDGNSTNLFLSLFSERFTPIGDLIFTKCYSEFYSSEKLEERFNRVVSFFDGNSSLDEVRYIHDDLKVKAVVVTPLDGLWSAPGSIEEKYPVKFETDGYRVYLAE